MSNFTLLGCLEVVDLWLLTKARQASFHRINGFLSLQLELRMELGWGLRLTKNTLCTDDDNPVTDGRFPVGFNPVVSFTSTSTVHDNLAFLYYLGNQLGLTTSMVVGEVIYGGGLVGPGSGKLVYVGPVHVIVGVGQQGGTDASKSCKINIFDEYPLPTSVKQESPAFSSYTWETSWATPSW